MDTDTLVENLLDDGQKLVAELLQHGFEVAAAFWIQPSWNGKWYFYLVSPLVDAEGFNKAYRRLHPLIYARPQSVGIDPLEIRLIGPSDPLARDVLAALSRVPVKGGGPIRWPGTWLGNLSIDGAYFYPVPAATP